MSLLFQDRTRPHQFLAAILWTVSVVATLIGGAIAAMTAMMAVSLDWGEAISAGADPWVNAMAAIGEAVGVAGLSVLGMVLWHTRRFKPIAPGLVAAAALLTVWLLVRFIGEYT